MSRNALLKTSRLVHLYFGVFITPALMFFALSGAVQTFGLHETNRDHPNYKPVRWLVVMAQVHKKQTTIVPVRKPQPPADAKPASGPHHDVAAENQAAQPLGAQNKPVQSTVATPKLLTPEAPSPRPLPLRIFFLIVCIGLFSSTVTGLYMSYKYIRNKLLVTVTLVAGIFIPIILALL